MPRKIRNDKRRGAVKDFEAAWLDSDRDSDIGFLYSLNHDFVHRELWDRAGDSENLYWTEGMDWPVPKDESPKQPKDRKDNDRY
jgi:hypothetical protein